MSVALPQSRPIASLDGRSRAARCAVAAALLAGALLAGAQPARAENIGEKIILRCTHAESLSGFTQSEYSQALSELEADAEEYGECAQRIRQAQLAAAVGGRGAGAVLTGSGGAIPVPIPATPAEQRAIAHAQDASPGAIALGGRVVHPGVVHVDIASALSALPSPLLATLAFLLACLLLVGGTALRKRVRGRAR